MGCADAQFFFAARFTMHQPILFQRRAQGLAQRRPVSRPSWAANAVSDGRDISVRNQPIENSLFNCPCHQFIASRASREVQFMEHSIFIPRMSF